MSTLWSSRYAQRTLGVKSSAIRELLKVTQKPEIISFGGGLPAPDVFPVKRFEEACHKVLTDYGAQALQYGTTEGPLGFPMAATAASLGSGSRNRGDGTSGNFASSVRGAASNCVFQSGEAASRFVSWPPSPKVVRSALTIDEWSNAAFGPNTRDPSPAGSQGEIRTAGTRTPKRSNLQLPGCSAR